MGPSARHVAARTRSERPIHSPSLAASRSTDTDGRTGPGGGPQAPPRRRKHWGWGFEDEAPSAESLRAQAAAIVAHLGFGDPGVELPTALDDVVLAPPRCAIPAALAEVCTDSPHARARHALGSSYVDTVRGFRGDFAHPPDIVAYPRGERDLEEILGWCSASGAAAIPYGGGTSVVGGVEPRSLDRYAATVTVDMSNMAGLLELDHVSRAARLAAGTAGPAIEAALAPHGLTLRHYPQSFQLSTLGGWIATRAAGHYAMLWTHIEDVVESVRALTPVGPWESRRLPGSGAGVSPDRMLAGSEGTLGVITEAWVRVRPRPIHRAGASVHFESFLR
ncbi:MAG: FAD-binding oxidoreductase, partial [Acidobacteriota bacterium]|nr:FAD-binding oxidoreductase [Acidobacteriota bacterium]